MRLPVMGSRIFMCYKTMFSLSTGLWYGNEPHDYS